MSRRDSGITNSPGDHAEMLSEAECQHIARQLADRILDPSADLLYRSLEWGLGHPEVVAAVLQAREGLSVDELDFANSAASSLRSRDRNQIISVICKFILIPSKTTKELGLWLLQVDFLRILRKSLDSFVSEFKIKAGRIPKIRKQLYGSLAERADALYPLCLTLLAELRSAKRTDPKNLLERSKSDYPLASAFLLKHYQRLQEALKSKALRSRATGLEGRARVIADAMAGAEYNLALRTSLERVREGRRASRPTSQAPPDRPPQNST